MIQPGPKNLITDVAGLLVGHATDVDARTGVSVMLLPGGWTAAADVRGGGPATREIEVLGLANLVGRAHALVFSGGSVFGLAAADGVTVALSARDEGLRLGTEPHAIPIVVGACLHDLSNGGDKAWGTTPPYRSLGMEAVEKASEMFDLGAVGAGCGAMAGTANGGIGSASLDLGDGLVVGALAAVNPVGSVYVDTEGRFFAAPFEWGTEFGGRRAGSASLHDPLPLDSKLSRFASAKPGAATTLCAVAVSADLSGPECQRVAMMAQDGLARAIRPAHTPFDGDLVICAASGTTGLGSEGRAFQVARLGAAAADVLARAIARGVYAAEG